MTPFPGQPPDSDPAEHAPDAAPARLAGRHQSVGTSACTTSTSSSALNENWRFGPAPAALDMG
ncbi:hypothetical protein IPZ69_29390 [Streptomyces olivochromogenes]|nr:hypothetical protein [Streptomyces olivochromogenes]